MRQLIIVIIIENEIETAIIPLYDVPNQMMKIIPDADLGIALIMVKYGSIIFIKESSKNKKIEMIIPNTVEINNATTASKVDINRCSSNNPFNKYSMNNLTMFEGFDKRNSLIILKRAKTSQLIRNIDSKIN